MLTSEFPPYTWGGVGRYSSEAVESLRHHAWVDVINVPSYARESPRAVHETSDGPNGRVLHVSGVEVTRAEVLRDLRAAPSVPFGIADWLAPTYDVLFAQDYFVAPLAAAIHQSGWVRKLVAYSHLPLYAGFSYFDRPSAVDRQHVLEALLFRLADLALVPSRFAAGVVEQSHNVAADRIVVLPPGTAAPDSLSGREPLRLPRVALISVARMTHQKGLCYLPDLLKQLRSRDLRPQCVLVGRGPLEDDITARLRAGIDDGSVRWVRETDGFDGIYQYYEGADICVSLSLYETFGLAMLEGMARGCIPVGFDISAIRELVGLDLASELVPVGNVDALADRIDTIVRDPSRTHRLSEAAVRRASAFDWESHAATLVRLFGELLV